MGLAHRIIPTILCRGRELVKGRHFDSWRSVGVATQAVRIQAMRGVDEIMLLDIAATAEGRRPDFAFVLELVDKGIFVPFAVGGGVRSIDDVRGLLNAGADHVVIGAAAIEDPRLVPLIASIVGSQAITVALDVKDGICWTRNGTVPWPSESAADVAERMSRYGAGEILLTAIEREGTLEGYDLELIARVRDRVRCPIVANGGCGSYQHMREAINAGASAVAAGAFFQFTDCTPKGAAQYLHQRGVKVRL